jgi:hypothetical protein
MKINKKYYCSNFFLCQKLKSRVSFIQFKLNLGYFLAWFQSLKLPSAQSESPLTLIPCVFLKYVFNCEQNCSFFMFRSGLTVTGLPRTHCTCYVLYFTFFEIVILKFRILVAKILYYWFMKYSRSVKSHTSHVTEEPRKFSPVLCCALGRPWGCAV